MGCSQPLFNDGLICSPLLSLVEVKTSQPPQVLVNQNHDRVFVFLYLPMMSSNKPVDKEAVWRRYEVVFMSVLWPQKWLMITSETKANEKEGLVAFNSSFCCVQQRSGFCRSAHANLILCLLLQNFWSSLQSSLQRSHSPILLNFKGSSSSCVSSQLQLDFPLYLKPWTCAKAAHLINSMALKCITAKCLGNDQSDEQQSEKMLPETLSSVHTLFIQVYDLENAAPTWLKVVFHEWSSMTEVILNNRSEHCSTQFQQNAASPSWKTS